MMKYVLNLTIQKQSMAVQCDWWTNQRPGNQTKEYSDFGWGNLIIVVAITWNDATSTNTHTKGSVFLSLFFFNLNKSKWKWVKWNVAAC